jgi:hypothetical protein
MSRRRVLLNDPRVVWLPILLFLVMVPLHLNLLPPILHWSVGNRLLPLEMLLLLFGIVGSLAAVTTGIGVGLGEHNLKLGSGFLGLH